MNCQELDLTLRDLARDSNRNSEQWKSAGFHLENCPQCSARLAEESVLQTRLGQLASAMKSIDVPVRLEARLLNACRQEQLSRQAGHLSRLRTIGWRWALVGGGTALLAITLAWHRLSDKKPSPAGTGSQPSNNVSTAPSDRSNGSGAAGEFKEALHQPLQTASQQLSRLKPPERRQAATIRRVPKSVGAERKRKVLPEPADYLEPEVATGFIPFMAVGGPFPGEQQQLVRIKLPRSALETFGLPVNRERVLEPVKADVLIGEDGMVQAIRFVY